MTKAFKLTNIQVLMWRFEYNTFVSKWEIVLLSEALINIHFQLLHWYVHISGHCHLLHI